MEMLDDDKNGTIDAFEFMCTMAMLSRGTLDERIALLFALYDFDESGIVTQDEFTALMFNAWTALLAMEKKERPNLNDVEFKVSTILKYIDRESNKKITLKEFQDYVKKDS